MSLTLTFQHTVILLYSFYNCEFLTWRHSGQGTQKPLLRKAQHRPPHTEASQAFHTTAFSAASSFKLTFEIDYFELFPRPFFWANTGDRPQRDIGCKLFQRIFISAPNLQSPLQWPFWWHARKQRALRNCNIRERKCDLVGRRIEWIVGNRNEFWISHFWNVCILGGCKI